MAVEANVVFRVKATGDDLHFQWQKNRQDLRDVGRYCNTDTATLNIEDVEKYDKGRYRCIVETSVGKMPSREASLTVGMLVMMHSSTLGNVLRKHKIGMTLICTSTSLCSTFLQNPQLQPLVLRVSSIHVHNSGSVKGIRHLFHLNQVLNIELGDC